MRAIGLLALVVTACGSVSVPPDEAALAAARARYDQDPTSVEGAVWYGRRLGYLGRFEDAIAVYSKALVLHPDEPHLLRHRGHRYISTRQFEAAIADLTRAAAAVAGMPDEVEPDGQPNERNVPTSTLQSNIHYHLGLAHFLRGEYPEALAAYEACERVATNPDMLAATLHWKYSTLRRLGRTAQARACVEAVRADWDIIENHDYHRLLLMYRGDLTPEAVRATLDGGKPTTIASAGFGLANWLRAEGKAAEADALCRRILAEAPGAAFGRIAAEVDLGRW